MAPSANILIFRFLNEVIEKNKNVRKSLDGEVFKSTKKAIEKYPDMNFISGDIFSLITNKYDWVFASGIFCFKYRWREHAILNIEKMYSLSGKGCAFNFLSANTSGKKINGMKYARISEVVSIIESLTNKFTIRHDYLNNDFTVYLYK